MEARLEDAGTATDVVLHIPSKEIFGWCSTPLQEKWVLMDDSLMSAILAGFDVYIAPYDIESIPEWPSTPQEGIEDAYRPQYGHGDVTPEYEKFAGHGYGVGPGGFCMQWAGSLEVYYACNISVAAADLG